MKSLTEKVYATVREYQLLDEASLEKIEFHHGEIIEMAGESPIHSLLGAGIAAEISKAVRKNNRDCSVFDSNLKISIGDNHFVYPNATVVCGEVKTSRLISQAVTNPTIIVEVLSPTTALYDREGKFQAYQQIKSFREYVLVSQDNILVEVYYKAEGWNFWKYRSYNSLSDKISLESIDVSISVNDIYLGWEPAVESE